MLFFSSGYAMVIQLWFVFMWVVVLFIITQKHDINYNFIENLNKAPAYYPSLMRYPGFKWLYTCVIISIVYFLPT